METPYSKQDEVIDSGIRALQGQAVDTSRMASVLNPKPTRSVVLPVGLATAAACVLGAVVLMTPTKADAGELEKVRQAVKSQPAVFERVLKPTAKADVFEIRCESWKDGNKSGVKLPAKEGLYEVVLDDKKIYEKTPKAEFYEVALVKSPDKVGKVVRDKAEGVMLQLVEVEFIDAEMVLAEHEPQTINEILARDGMQFLGVQRGQKKENRICDVYRVKLGQDANETLFYVDSKTDLPFLKEELDEAGKVARRIEISFPGEIRLDIKLTDKDHVIKVEPIKVRGSIKLDDHATQDVVFRTRLIDKVKATPESPVEKPIPPKY